MSDNLIYRDIAKRGGGDIYIGVVGPVRSGKSTFIQRFLDTVVIPGIENEFDRERTLDQMPQSASGKTVMTTEPKFIPDESVKVCPGDGIEFNVKLVDCVGYMVDGALGAEEDGEQRLVKTPWSEEPMPFASAAELGTGKVIDEHSTIAMLITTDGSIADIPRENYVPAEERIVKELREAKKPFAIILNSAEPESESARALAEQLEKKYNAPIALVCCPNLNADDIREILALVLGEFPVKEMEFTLPEWTEVLPTDHPLKSEIISSINDFSARIERLGDIDRIISDEKKIERVSVNAGDGTAAFKIPLNKDEYYKTVSEFCGRDIGGERELLHLIKELSDVGRRYEKVASALSDVEEKGYGIVLPSIDELELEEPKLVKSAGGFGVKVSAHAGSIHMIKTDIKADICPVVGSEEQSMEVVSFLKNEYEENPDRVWEYNMFGKSLYDLVSDTMDAKLTHMPDDSREKLGETLGKIINEGSNGLICILL